MTDSGTRPHWGLDYDAAQFIALPPAEAPASEGDAWVDAAVAHYEGGAEPLTDQDRAALQVTARAVLSMVEPYITRLWFAPPGLYSDVLVSIVLTPAVGETADELIAQVTGDLGATSPDAVMVETTSHGSGLLVRRTSGVQPENAQALLVAQWDLLLRDGGVLIAVNAMGTTMPAFALLEGELAGLVDGIRLGAED
ncbi:hypothetical protein [Microbacterium sp.]|uniref:hypothetical protein n=1 Tax=Microbacterium sp. TaxID=51671 RepID=UPI0028AA6926|nr:hypothetical protein [Microbacterium sp.]